MALNLEACGDQELVSVYRASGPQAEEAYNLLVNRYYTLIVKTCRYYLFQYSGPQLLREDIGAQASDIAHDFLMDQLPRVLQRYETSRGSFRTWLVRCVINFTMDYLRRRPKARVEPLQVEEEEWKSYEIVVHVLGEDVLHRQRDIAELRQVLLRYLSELPDHYRQPVELRFWENLSVEEVAKRLRLPVGTVKSQLSRAMKILRQRLEAEGLAEELRG
ncbi:MAG: sigma-70 family RNA polymerase sigma factor [Bacteroidia bacterium]|nr:sigma-70 family RNA polymerase sigma factor [Bacteroidia bacterium]MDW8089397.1 sigma-70 family RNA polymerase sigma factor [Bacteroidia bacterium]